MGEKIKVTPEICSYTDEEHNALAMEISIPGAKKEDISIKMHEDSFYLSSPRADIESVAALAFCCPVVQEKAEAKYENGLLRIRIPFRDPLENAVQVPVS